jgi:putative thioredoxin
VETNTNVIEVTDATFEEVVVEGSKQRPVVVDLWATWCGPCKTLGPLLEKVAAERDGAFLLAKLDVDANPMVAKALGVQSIPTVVAFSNGEPVNGFVGAYPEEAVNQFVDLIVPTEAELDVEVAQAEAEAGDLPGAEQDFRDALAKDPQSRDAAVGLGKILVERGDLQEARGLLGPLVPDTEAERLLAAARVKEWGDAPADGLVGAGMALGAAGRWREALDGLIAALETDRQGAQAALLDAFAALGDDDPLVLEYRKKLASALF